MNTLVDTSVWIDHFNKINDKLVSLLEENAVYTHPFIIGEIACGNLKNRNDIIDSFQVLPQAEILNEKEALHFLYTHHLYGKGIGWIDLHLLASSKLSNLKLFTLDKKLEKAAKAVLK